MRRPAPLYLKLGNDRRLGPRTLGGIVDGWGVAVWQRRQAAELCGWRNLWFHAAGDRAVWRRSARHTAAGGARCAGDTGDYAGDTNRPIEHPGTGNASASPSGGRSGDTSNDSGHTNRSIEQAGTGIASIARSTKSEPRLYAAADCRIWLPSTRKTSASTSPACVFSLSSTASAAAWLHAATARRLRLPSGDASVSVSATTSSIARTSTCEYEPRAHAATACRLRLPTGSRSAAATNTRQRVHDGRSAAIWR